MNEIVGTSEDFNFEEVENYFQRNNNPRIPLVTLDDEDLEDDSSFLHKQNNPSKPTTKLKVKPPSKLKVKSPNKLLENNQIDKEPSTSKYFNENKLLKTDKLLKKDKISKRDKLSKTDKVSKTDKLSRTDKLLKTVSAINENVKSDFESTKSANEAASSRADDQSDFETDKSTKPANEATSSAADEVSDEFLSSLEKTICTADEKICLSCKNIVSKSNYIVHMQACLTRFTYAAEARDSKPVALSVSLHLIR